MSATTRLVQDLIEKYRGMADAEQRILQELGPAATEADKAAVKAAVGSVPGSALSPQDIQARAAQRPATPPPARSITDLAEPPRDPLSLRPERDPLAGKPDAPGPLRALQQEAGAAPIPEAPAEAVATMKQNMEKSKASKLGKAAMAGTALAAGGAGLALLRGNGQEAPKTAAPAQPAKPSPQAAAQGKKELKQVVTESKEEYPLSNSLKLTAPEDVGAALRAADKDTPDSKLSPDVRKDFAAKRGELEKRMQDAEKMYMAALATGKEDRKRRDMIIAVAGVVERLGLALTSYFAAKQGMAMGAPVASKLQIQPSDANAAFDRSLREYDQLAEEQKGLFSFRTRGIEREQDLLGRQEEKFEAGEQRKAERAEDRAFAEGKLAEDKRQFEEAQRFRREEGAAERASRERIAKLGMDSRESIAALRQQYRSQLDDVKTDAKKQAAVNKVVSIVGTWDQLNSKQKQAGLNEINQNLADAGMADLGPVLAKAASEGKAWAIGDFFRQYTGGTTATKQAVGAVQARTQGTAQASPAPAGMVRLRNPETGKVHEMTEAEAAEARNYGYTDVR